MVKLSEYSPLQALAGAKGMNVNVNEKRFAKITVRGKAENPAFVSAVEKVTGAKLPIKAWSVAKGKSDITIFWLSPDEWLVRGKDGCQLELLAELRQQLGGTHSACVDVSDYYLCIEITGNNAVDVLQKGCIVDLHPDAFKVGYATGTRYEKATINLYKTASDSYELTVRQSFGEYLWQHLVHGAKEFG